MPAPEVAKAFVYTKTTTFRSRCRLPKFAVQRRRQSLAGQFDLAGRHGLGRVAIGLGQGVIGLVRADGRGVDIGLGELFAFIGPSGRIGYGDLPRIGRLQARDIAIDRRQLVGFPGQVVPERMEIVPVAARCPGVGAGVHRISASIAMGKSGRAATGRVQGLMQISHEVFDPDQGIGLGGV